MNPPVSPCDGTCRIEPASGLCAGCSRTLAEIAGWATMSHPEQRALLAVLAGRRR
jgi:predicted Fe-S protein YdhL (DUF1289 family)